MINFYIKSKFIQIYFKSLLILFLVTYCTAALVLIENSMEAIFTLKWGNVLTCRIYAEILILVVLILKIQYSFKFLSLSVGIKILVYLMIFIGTMFYQLYYNGID